MFNDAEAQLKSAKILPSGPHHKKGAVIIRELLRKGSISEDAFYNLIGIDIGDELLESNIFTYPSYSNEIAFQSTVIRRFCEENSTLWKGK